MRDPYITLATIKHIYKAEFRIVALLRNKKESYPGKHVLTGKGLTVIKPLNFKLYSEQ